CRRTQLDGLQRVCNGMREMEELLHIVTGKFQDLLEVQAINLWLEQEGELLLVQRHGEDPTLEVGMTQKSGDGIATEVSDSGAPVVIDDPEDSRLQKRNTGVEEGAIFSIMAAPLIE